jgi:DHA2 family methylenomycin A resistance protein-like MFS transporter
MVGARQQQSRGRSDSATEHPGRFRALLGLSFGYFMVLLDTTVLSVAEPDIARSLGASVGELQWVVDGYTITLAACLLSAGAVADRLGAHRVFRYGIAGFGLLSLLTACAPSVGLLIGLRAILGVAAALCIPSSMAMITRLYPEPAARSRALAAWTAISGAGLASGPLVGGAVVAATGWRGVFIINVPVAVLVLVLVTGSRFVAPLTGRRIDLAAQLLAGVTLALLSGALISFGGRDVVLAAELGVAAVAVAAALVVVERRSASPVFAPQILRVRGVVAGLIAGAAVNFVLTGAIFVLPLLLIEDLDLTPVRIGMVLLPLTIPCALNPLLTGRLVARYGPRPPIIGGLALLTVGSAALTVAVADHFPTMLTAAGLAITGFGISFTLPALITAVLSAAPEGTAGSVGGLLNAVRQMGATIGVAVLGALVAAGHDGLGRAGAMGTAAIVSAVGCSAYVLLTRPARSGAAPR